MDLVKILQDSISKLPPGPHTPGLLAILRHITVAVRHFEEGTDRHSDRFTDAIYRTNQAYEGSLKEAYRVIAGGDPAKKTPNQIEEYFEKNSILRDRVILQIRRYRQDYRNPSTHDHKLDFDQDEALLAITSTCGFSKLLTDQIAERLAFNAAAASPPNQVSSDTFSNAEELALFSSRIAANALHGKKDFSFFSELEGLLGGSFSASGLEVETGVKNAEDDEWDMVVRKNDLIVPIEIRDFGPEFSTEDSHGLLYLEMAMETESLQSGINIIFSKNSKDEFEIFRLKSSSSIVFAVTNYDLEDLKKLRFFSETFTLVEKVT